MNLIQIIASSLAGFAILTAPAAAQQSAPLPEQTLDEKLADAAAANRHRLEFDGASFSGPAWDMLLAEGANAQFFLLGEEHGIAENAKLAAALFTALAPGGYSKLAIEVSPPMADALDDAARGGMDGLHALYAQPGGEPAFFGMKEEAEFLVAARAAVRNKEPLFWGADYEVAGDRLLLSRLEAKKKPAAAQSALAALREASDHSWTQYETTRNPQFIFSFAGDPALVRALRDAWPKHDEEAAWILDTFEETLEINRHWVSGEGYLSNVRRAAFLRNNFIRHWTVEKIAKPLPKVFAKFGASHLMRGRNSTETYDLGSLIPEIAALEGNSAFHLMVLPGAGSQTAVLDPSRWVYSPGPPKDSYWRGLEPVTGAAYDDAFTLIDLRPLRPLLGRWREGTSPEMMRIVHGYDALLVLSGSTPSADL